MLTSFARPTGDTTPTITGTAEAGATVTILNGSTILGTAVADDTGAFSLTPAVPLTDGTISLTARAVDPAGNSSGLSAATPLTIDTAAPGVPVITPFEGTTTDNTPTITGTAEAGATVTIFNGSAILGTAVADANGAFSLTPLVPLPNDTFSLTATAGDAAGNVSLASAPVALSVDTVVPNAPLVNYIAPTSDVTPVVTGTANLGDTITISAGGRVVGTGPAGEGGAFSITLSELPQGTNALTVTATRPNNEVSPAAP